MKNIVIPGARLEEHIKQNIDIFNFELSNEDMEEIAKIDRGVPYVTHNRDEMQKYLDWHPDIEGQK